MFFFKDPATTEIYSLSLRDALPIYRLALHAGRGVRAAPARGREDRRAVPLPGHHRRLPLPAADRKSTRLNSSHANISYAVFCLKKKERAMLLLAAATGDLRVMQQSD